jgi:hypothetical protein
MTKMAEMLVRKVTDRNRTSERMAELIRKTDSGKKSEVTEMMLTEDKMQPAAQSS